MSVAVLLILCHCCDSVAPHPLYQHPRAFVKGQFTNRGVQRPFVPLSGRRYSLCNLGISPVHSQRRVVNVPIFVPGAHLTPTRVREYQFRPLAVHTVEQNVCYNSPKRGQSPAALSRAEQGAIWRGAVFCG